MVGESPARRSAGSVTCVFTLMMIVSLFFFPNEGRGEKLDPVLKGPRPYKSNITRASRKKGLSGLNIAKREHLFRRIIHAAADRYQVDAALVKAVIMAESGFDPLAVSKQGAVGLMQLMPGTAGELGVDDLFNPVHNVNAGVRYLKRLLNQFNGDLRLALAAYNAGSRSVEKYQGIPPFKSTQYYIQKVFKYYQYYRGSEI